MTDDELLARLYMADDPKDDPELEKLRQLRAVWLALPEEEPPKHGMAELMAAARAKAVEMQPRSSWWQTLLVTLRRPPVLALATVMVLVGGAVFIGRRNADVEAPALAPRTPPAGTIARGPVTPANESAPGMTAGEAASGSAAAIPSRDRGAAPTVTVAPAGDPQVANPVAGDKAGKDAPTDTTPRKAPPAKAEPVRRPAPPAAHAALKSKAAKLDDVSESNNGVAPEPSKSGGAVDSNAPPPVATPSSQEQPAPTPAAPQQQPARPSATPPPAPVTTPTTQAESVDQLVKQCQTAAARGDCSAVRTLAARIAKADAARYRDKVSKDAAVAKCLLAE